MSNEVIQIASNGTLRTAPALAFEDARRRFGTTGYLKLPQFIEPCFLGEILAAIDRAEFYERVHDGIGVELCAVPGALSGALELACNDPRLFDLVDELTGCGAIGCFEGRVYRMAGGTGHYDSWHSDVGQDRMIAMSVNLGRDPFEGGQLQIRRTNSTEILAEVENPTPGDAVIFRIDPQYRHRVASVVGPAPRTAYAGWFRALPDYYELMRARLLD